MPFQSPRQQSTDEYFIQPIGTNLVHFTNLLTYNVTAVTFSVKLGIICEKLTFP